MEDIHFQDVVEYERLSTVKSTSCFDTDKFFKGGGKGNRDNASTSCNTEYLLSPSGVSE